MEPFNQKGIVGVLILIVVLVVAVVTYVLYQDKLTKQPQSMFQPPSSKDSSMSELSSLQPNLKDLPIYSTAVLQNTEPKPLCVEFIEKLVGEGELREDAEAIAKAPPFPCDSTTYLYYSKDLLESVEDWYDNTISKEGWLLGGAGAEGINRFGPLKNINSRQTVAYISIGKVSSLGESSSLYTTFLSVTVPNKP